MTVQTETSISGPYAGSGTTGPFTVGFRFLADSHLLVVKTSSAGVDTTLALTTDYTVTGAGGSSGTVTLVTALATGESLTIARDVPFTQLADYVNNDAFPAESHEDALDLLTMQTQQLKELGDRSLSLPVTAVGVSTELPAPEASTIIGWNAAGDALDNVPLSSLATAIAATTWRADTFNGTGAATSFVLTDNPGNTFAVLCSVGGVVQTPGVNFTISGTTLTFLTGAPPAGTNNVVAQYGQSLAQVGAADLTNVTGTLAIANGGTGATSAAAAPFALKGANSDITSLSAITSINGGQLAGLRNRIINGDMRIDQRNAGAAQNITASATYSLDRFAVAATAAVSGTLTVQRQSVGVNAGSASGFAARIAKTSGAFNGTLYAGQVVESSNCFGMAGKTVTLSFKARVGSSFTGTTTPAKFFYTGTGTDQGLASAIAGTWTGFVNQTFSLVANANPTLTTSFQTYSFSVTLPSDAAEIFVAVGRTTDGSTGTANDYIDITDLQLEVGSVATPFEHRPYGAELALCQRYCQAYANEPHGMAADATYNVGRGVFSYSMMRAAPTLRAGASFAVNAGSAGTPSISGATTTRTVLFNSAANWTVSAVITFTGVLESEL